MRAVALSASLLVLLLFGCDNPRESAKGFKLPPGDAKAGEAVYTSMGCSACRCFHQRERVVSTKRLRVIRNNQVEKDASAR